MENAENAAREHAEREIRRIKLTCGQDAALRVAQAYADFLSARAGAERSEIRAHLERLGFTFPEPSGAIPAPMPRSDPFAR